MISNGAISVFMGILPDIKTTEPYSPTARANAKENPVIQAGTREGKTTRLKVYHRLAPRLTAAFSISGSSDSKTGWRVRTTTRRPIKVTATLTPRGVKAT